MKKLKCLTSAPAHLSIAMPLIFGLATLAAAPTVKAFSIESVDIIAGLFDVTQGGVINSADDASDVALWCNDAGAVKFDIIDGWVDVDEDGDTGADGTSDTADDLTDCDLTDETDGPAGDNNGVPQTNQADVIDGLVDVTEGTVINAADAAIDIQLFDMLP